MINNKKVETLLCDHSYISTYLFRIMLIFNNTSIIVKIYILQDQGEPPRSSTTTLYINVIDADDQNPVFLTEQYKVTVPRYVKGVS